MLFALAYALLLTAMVAGVLWQMNRPRRKTVGVSLAMGGPGDPADLELAAREVEFPLADGSISPGWVIDGARPQGPVAVVVHGHRDSRFGSLYRAQMLAPYTAAVAVFDLPGHGDAAAARCLMGEREARDVVSVARHLADHLPAALAARPVVLLGYSMGATIVIKAAAAEPGRFAGVIACAPYRFWDQGLRGQLRRRGLPAWPTVPLVGLILRAAQVLKLPGPGGLGEPPGLDRAADAAGLDAPLLVLHGDADDICPLDAGRAIARAAPDGKLVVIAGGTHNQLLAADHDAVHAALQTFFAKLDGPDAARGSSL